MKSPVTPTDTKAADVAVGTSRRSLARGAAWAVPVVAVAAAAPSVAASPLVKQCFTGKITNVIVTENQNPGCGPTDNGYDWRLEIKATATYDSTCDGSSPDLAGYTFAYGEPANGYPNWPDGTPAGTMTTSIWSGDQISAVTNNLGCATNAGQNMPAPKAIGTTGPYQTFFAQDVNASPSTSVITNLCIPIYIFAPDGSLFQTTTACL